MDGSTAAPGTERHAVTMVCRSLGALAAATDGALLVRWHTGAPRPGVGPGPVLFDLAPLGDRAPLQAMWEHLESGAADAHGRGPSGIDYAAYDGRRTAFGHILWVWSPPPPAPPGARPAAAPEGVGAEGVGADAFAGLSDRERTIALAILAGSRVSSISRQLFVGTSTVRSHLSAAFRKLGVHSQAELIERYGGPPPEGASGAGPDRSVP